MQRVSDTSHPIERVVFESRRLSEWVSHAQNATGGVHKPASGLTERICHADRIAAVVAELSRVTERISDRNRLARRVVSKGSLVTQRIRNASQVSVVVVAERSRVVQRIGHARDLIECRLVSEVGRDSLARPRHSGD